MKNAYKEIVAKEYIQKLLKKNLIEIYLVRTHMMNNIIKFTIN